MNELTVITHSPEQTQHLGTILGRLASGGEIFLLIGNLGTGKTHLVQGIAFGLGVREYACSPSFMIAREYNGRLKLNHLDLYRLNNPVELIDLGLEEYLRPDSVCAVEWAEKGEQLFPHDNLTIRMERLGDSNRKITFIPHGSFYNQLTIKLIQELKRNKIEWSYQ